MRRQMPRQMQQSFAHFRLARGAFAMRIFARSRRLSDAPRGTDVARDVEAARRYWKAQVEADHERRGVTDKHP